MLLDEDFAVVERWLRLLTTKVFWAGLDVFRAQSANTDAFRAHVLYSLLTSCEASLWQNVALNPL